MPPRLSFGTLFTLFVALAAPTVRAEDFIHVCTKNNTKNATMRVITPPATCRSNETEMTLLAGDVGRPAGNIGSLKVTNVSIDEEGTQARVSPGASFTVEFDYNATTPGCPSCILQRYVGLTSEPGPQSCHDSIPGEAPGETAADSHELTAPMTPGVYYIAIDDDLQFNCFDPGPQWPHGTPSTSDRIIGSIAVY